MKVVTGARPAEAVAGSGDRQRGGRRRRRVVLVVGVVVVVVVGAVAVWNRDLIGAYLTHRVGEPSQTWHHPPYSSGFHGSNTQVRDTFVPLFERYGVQIVFSGHEHDYQRTNPIDGVTYIVSGAGARTRGTATEDFTAVAWSTHHYVDLNIYPDHILLRAIDQDGEQFDEAVIPATIPPTPEAAR